ncbi:MAG: YafY family protein [Spirochaetota bacterium]
MVILKITDGEIMRIDRMLAITVMLLNRDRISARELADKFEVSVRTVYRDIDAINLAGIPVVSYPGNDGGFGIMENYRIDRQVLTLRDMFAILSALKGVNSGLKDTELECAIEKIQSLVPEEKSGEMELHFERLAIDLMPWGFSDRHKAAFKAIQNSINGNTLLKIKYSDAKGESSERIIEPMTLIMMGYTWYLFAFCRMRNSFRVFRLSRIKKIDALQQIFSRREASYKDYTGKDIDDRAVTCLVLKFSSAVRARVEDYFDEEQIDTIENGDMIVKVSYPEDDWVYSFILGYGEHVEVLEPPHIKKIICEKAKKVLQQYNSIK